jgi:hypothetical protein
VVFPESDLPMRHDFSAIPEPAAGRESGSRLLARIYRDIGLAAVAAALGLKAEELTPDEREAVGRGAFYLTPQSTALAS